MRVGDRQRPDLVYGTAFLLIAGSILNLSLRGGLWLILILPGISFTVVAVAYFSGSAFLFGKRQNGTRHWLATMILWPYLLFAKAVWRLQISLFREPAFAMVNDSLIIARRLQLHEYPAGLGLVCDLTSELCDPVEIRNSRMYRCVPILDANGLRPVDLVAIVQSLQIATGSRLLIHCANGHGRTGMVAAAWLIQNEFALSVDDALAQLTSARRGIRLRRRQRESLEAAVAAMHS